MRTVFASAFSPEGGRLACGTGSGELHVWDLTDASMEQMPEKHCCLRLHRSAIYSLVFVPAHEGTLLLTGSDEEIRGWSWKALLGAASEPPPPLFELQNPRRSLRRGGLGPLSETSGLVHDPSSNVLYSAAGDGNAYAWDLGTQKCVTTFSGHSDQLHCISGRLQRKQIVTGSEDGTVRLWDVRSGKSTATLLADGSSRGVSHTSSSGVAAAGSELGAALVSYGWCGCLAVDESENWLVAGWGGGFLCTFELSTLACIACLPTAASPQAVCFLPGSISDLVTAGAESNMYNWSLTGELHTRALCSSPSVYALSARRFEGRGVVVAAGGSADGVDIFMDTSHRAYTLML